MMYTTQVLSPIGTLALYANDTFLTEVSFIDEPPTSTPCIHPLLKMALDQFDEYFNGQRKTFDLPFSLEGTPFQKGVWEKLNGIPYGKTITYLSLAKQLGDAKAIRAVGTANGRNKLALIIPCHRVIGSNDKLIGYAGGLWRKKWLLEHEAKHQYGVQTLALKTLI